MVAHENVSRITSHIKIKFIYRGIFSYTSPAQPPCRILSPWLQFRCRWKNCYIYVLKRVLYINKCIGKYSYASNPHHSKVRENLMGPNRNPTDHRNTDAQVTNNQLSDVTFWSNRPVGSTSETLVFPPFPLSDEISPPVQRGELLWAPMDSPLLDMRRKHFWLLFSHGPYLEHDKSIETNNSKPSRPKIGKN